MRAEVILEALVYAARNDSRVGALFLVGSLAVGTDDAYSDIDLVLIPKPEAVQSLLADRRTWPAQFGDVLLQLDPSWNVWRGASQVLTLLDGELPLWVDMDIWPPWVPGIPRESRVLEGDARPRVDLSLSEFATMLKERDGLGVASENKEGVGGVASVAWGLKGIARGKYAGLEKVRQAPVRPWPPELERARKRLRRYAEHVGADERTV